MKNEERNTEEKAIRKQMEFCQNLMTRLIESFNCGCAKQDADKWDNYSIIRNRTRYAEDVRRVRRELLSLIKILEG